MVIGEDFFVLHGGVSVGEGYVGVAVWDEGFFNKSMAAGGTKVRGLSNCESVVDRSFFASSRGWTVPGSRCDLRQWQPEARSDPVCCRGNAANLSRTTAQRECGCARLPGAVSRDGCLAWLCVVGFLGGLLAGRCWLNECGKLSAKGHTLAGSCPYLEFSQFKCRVGQ